MLANKQLGKYHLVRPIGSGGMGEIFLAEDSRIPRQVAIKVMCITAEIPAYLAEKPEARKLFQREMRAVTMLNHPYILQLFDFGEESVDGQTFLYLVMPWQPEGSLADWLQRRGAEGGVKLSEAAHFVNEAADALQHVHEHELIHQDVKPTNFLVRSRSEAILPDVLLADFGISKITATCSLASQDIRGTPAYMAPEQWQGHPVPATDQYALAVMAYLLLTGRLPFTGSGLAQMLHQHFFVEPQPPSFYRPTIPPEVDATILTALAKKPEERFPSILDFAQVFQKEEHHPASPASSPFFAGCALPGKPTGFTTEAGASLISTPAEEPRDPAFTTQMSPSLLKKSSDTPAHEQSDVSFEASEGISAGYAKTGDTSGKPAISSRVAQRERRTGWVIPKGFVREKKGKILLVVMLLLLVLVGALGGNAFLQGQRSHTPTSTNTALLASPAYMPDVGSEILQDPLHSPRYWNPTDNAGLGGSCQYTNNALHVLETQKNRFYLCSDELTLPNNAQFEVKMRIVRGNCGDIYFRYDTNTEHGYLMKICTENNQGFYAIRKYRQLNDANPAALVPTGMSTAINSSPGASNTLGIAANGGHMTLYINGKKIVSSVDMDYMGGSLGLCADAAGQQTGGAEVAFTDARIWEIKS